MRIFITVWLGQVVSAVGSGLTSFALGVWVFQSTGSTTLFALIALSGMLPGALAAPFTGVLVDRWDRRRVMILADALSAASTLLLLILSLTGGLALWQIYLASAINSIAGSFQWPAFGAATTLLVPKKHLARAGGMTYIGTASARIASPLLAGVLLAFSGLNGIFVVDLVTFAVAVGTLLVVRFPRPPKDPDETGEPRSLWQESLFAWAVVRRYPGLTALLFLFAGVNFGVGMIQVLLAPLILRFTSEAVLGSILGLANIGLLCGSLTMSAWGGPRRRIRGVLGALAVSGTSLLVLGLRPEPLLIGGALAVYLFAAPIANASSQAIWQTKVAAGFQGRIFAIRRLLATSSLPLGYILAGPLADRVFEPLLAPTGLLSDSVGRWIGVGPGRGIGLLFMLLGVIMLSMVLLGAFFPPLRRLEEEVPDAVGRGAGGGDHTLSDQTGT